MRPGECEAVLSLPPRRGDLQDEILGRTGRRHILGLNAISQPRPNSHSDIPLLGDRTYGDFGQDEAELADRVDSYDANLDGRKQLARGGGPPRRCNLFLWL